MANATAGGSPGSSLLLSPTGGGGGADSNNASALEEDDDDYTPLDPAYLPPGLDDEAEEEDKENLEV